jgi:hypothetical protein
VIRRRLIFVALVAFLLPSVAQAGPQWPNPHNRVLATLPQPAMGAWLERCGPGGHNKVVQVRQLKADFGAIKSITPCLNAGMSDPALAYTPYHNRLYVAWSQVSFVNNKSFGKGGIYYALSTNGGASWSKPRLAFPLLKTYFPPPVKAAAYVQKLWFMWAKFAPGKRQVPFNIQAINTFTGRRGLPVAGVAKFTVLPDPSALYLFSGKDGVAAFWLTQDLNKGSWHLADTERVDPNDVSKRVVLLYRGEVGLADRTRFFAGLDGKLYRAFGKNDNTDILNPVRHYFLDRYAFLKHQFAWAYQNEEVFKATVPISNLVNPDVAYQVDTNHNLYLTYSDIYVNGKETYPTCFFSTLQAFCDAEAPGQAFASITKVRKFTRLAGGAMGEQSEVALPQPVATAPTAAAGLYLQGLKSYGQARSNMIYQAADGLHLLATDVFGKTSTTKKSSVLSADSQDSFFTLSPPFH